MTRAVYFIYYDCCIWLLNMVVGGFVHCCAVCDDVLQYGNFLPYSSIPKPNNHTYIKFIIFMALLLLFLQHIDGE